MPLKTLTMTVGLPRSGKSTWARGQGVPVVNPDSIRTVLHGTAFRPEAEPMVWGIAKTMVRSLFEAGHERVILDATNITNRRRQEWSNGAWECEYVVFRTPAVTCVLRARDNDQEYLVDVIRRMDRDFEMPKSNVVQVLYSN